MTLLYILRKTGRKAMDILSCVHPKIMCNIEVARGAFHLKDENLVWVRRQGWAMKPMNSGKERA